MRTQPGHSRRSLTAALLCAVASHSCGPNGATTPAIYERWTTDGAFVLAMVEPPERYVASFGYEVTSEDRRILERYPSDGVYRAGEPDAPILELARPVRADDIAAFFSRNQSAFLVHKTELGLVFHQDGDETRRLDGDAEGWTLLPWHKTAVVGFLGIDGDGFKARLDSSANRPRIRVQASEATHFVYDALTGERLEAVIPPILPPVEPSGEERGLIGFHTAIRSLAQEGRRFEAAQQFQARWAEPLAGCDGFERDQAKELDEQSFAESQQQIAQLTIRAYGKNLPVASRVLHSESADFDLYRVPASRAWEFLCGNRITQEQFLLKLIDTVGLERAAEIGTSLWDQWSGPTTAVAVVLEAKEPETPIDSERVGLVFVWASTPDGWRMLGFTLMLQTG